MKTEEGEGRPQGLPANAPDWAKNTGTILYKDGCCHGVQVRVDNDGGYTVVRLMEGCNSLSLHRCWEAEKQLFATRDGEKDHTAEYRKFRFSRKKDNDIAKFLAAGLSVGEAHRLFRVGQQRWAREFEAQLLNPRVVEQCRSNKEGLCVVAVAEDREAQEDAMDLYKLSFQVEYKGDFLRVRSIALRALWVFHDLPEVPSDFNPASVRTFPTEGKGWKLVTS